MTKESPEFLNLQKLRAFFAAILPLSQFTCLDAAF